MLLFLSFRAIGQPELAARYFSLVESADNLAYRDFVRSDSLYNQAELLIRNFEAPQKTLFWISLQHHRASACYFNYRYSLVQKYIDEAFSSIEESSHLLSKEKKDSLIAETKFIQAIYFNDIGKYDHALDNFMAFEKYIKATDDNVEKCKRTFQLIQYQAYIYQVKGEYESAVNAYLSSIPYYDCYRDKMKVPNYLLVYRNIAITYQQLGNNDLSYSYFSKAIKNLNNQASLTEYSIRNHALVLYHSIGGFFILQGSFDSAKFYYQKSIPFLKDNPIAASRIYQGLANVAQQEKDFDTSLSLFLKTLEIVRNANGEKHYITCRIYMAISKLYLQKSDLSNALLFIQKAINSLTGPEEIKITEIEHNPSLRFVVSKKEMIEALHQKTLLLRELYRNANTRLHLINAYRTNGLAIQLLDSARNEFTLEKDKVVLGEEAVRIYEMSIAIAHELYESSADSTYLSECFVFMDKSKSAVLLDHLKFVKSFSRIPLELQEKERLLKAELSVAEAELFKAESQNQNTLTQRQALSDLKNAHAALFAEIKTSYPHYYNLRIHHNTISVNDVQTKLLSPGQALVEYFVGDSSLYMICITPKQSWMYRSSVDSLRDQVITLRDRIISRDQTELNINAKALYDQLVHPWIARLDPSITSLIIVPHGVLSYLPFEMLTPKGQNATLLSRFSISYASSASLLSEQNRMDVSGTSFAGFNADYGDQQNFPQLRGSVAEVRTIHEMLGSGGKVFLNSTAEDFRKEAPQYRVLHLALHSLINDERPLFSRLVFSGFSPASSEVTANELYNMELNADMAVLSACESGIGKLHRGEGMMSLSRAFMYAGVPSTVISLWKVPDYATSVLMAKFYEFLKLGQSKHLALANAKREFIKDNPEMSAPIFWAGFVVNGKTAPIALGHHFEMWTIMRAVIFMLAIVFVLILWSRYKVYRSSVR